MQAQNTLYNISENYKTTTAPIQLLFKRNILKSQPHSFASSFENRMQTGHQALCQYCTQPVYKVRTPIVTQKHIRYSLGLLAFMRAGKRIAPTILEVCKRAANLCLCHTQQTSLTDKKSMHVICIRCRQTSPQRKSK